MRIVRAEVEKRQTPELTFTQMQALGFLLTSPGTSLAELAAHLGLQSPTTSKVVEELVRQRRVTRTALAGNRRKLSLCITASGRKVMEAAAEPAVTRMATLLGQLNVKERAVVERAMSVLHPVVQPTSDRDATNGGT